MALEDECWRFLLDERVRAGATKRVSLVSFYNFGRF